MEVPRTIIVSQDKVLVAFMAQVRTSNIIGYTPLNDAEGLSSIVLCGLAQRPAAFWIPASPPVVFGQFDA